MKFRKFGLPTSTWLLLVAALALGGCHQENGDPSTSVAHIDPAPHAVENFTLIERSGQPFESDSLRGKVWVASFFFVTCPGICLKMNQTIADLQKELDPEVRFVSITVDPDKDTPESLRAYAERLGANDHWLFLTGSLRDIKDIANDSFQVSAAQEVHSERLMVVDREGRVRGRFMVSDGAQMTLLKRRIAELLKEPS